MNKISVKLKKISSETARKRASTTISTNGGHSIDWTRVAKLLLTSRAIDRIEETELVPQGKVKYQFSARGHELAQILLALSMQHKHDAATVYYRSRPFVLAQGLTPEESFAASMARRGSPNGGRDIGVVHALPSRGHATVLPTSGDVGAQYTPATGWAQSITYYSKQLKETSWNGAMAAALGGEASTATNGFWAALNIASVNKLPLLFFIEDNTYGISVPGTLQTPGGDITKNLASFGSIKILSGDGTDPEECSALIRQATEFIRSGNGPCLLRVSVPRLCGHSGADNQSYKTPAQKAAEEARDPLPKLKAFCEKNYKINWKELEESVEREVRTACERALAQTEPDPSTAKHYAFSENIFGKENPAKKTDESKRINLIDAVRRTLEVELEKNPKLLVFGEDVGVKGGVHGATVGMQQKFGIDRVFDTSLSEEGIIGRAVGMAMAGLMPVAEIQFRKYADPAHEQITDCGTVRWRTNNNFSAPIVVRMPVGHGKATGDPWHSVSGEAAYAHLIGWRIAFPSNAEDAVGLLRSALRGQDPTMFFEHRALLDQLPSRRPYPGDEFTLAFGKGNIVQEGSALTIVTWGEMVHRALEAIKDIEEGVEVIDLRTIVPWDKELVFSSVKKTSRVLILHEDTMTAGFGGEIASSITEECFESLDAPVARLATSDVPIPYNQTLMNAVVPTINTIREKVRELLEY